MLWHESLPLVRHVLATFIVPKRFESLASLLLSPSLIVLESVKCFTLFMEEPAAAVARGIISERDPVFESVSSRRERTVKVRVNKLQGDRATRSRLGEWVSSLLPIHARGTDWNRVRHIWERKIGYHFMLNQRFKTRGTDMSKTTMPELIASSLWRRSKIRNSYSAPTQECNPVSSH